jgi:hypothetical protein
MSTTILATRFNNLQNRLAAVLGTSTSATPTFGYGQLLNADIDVAGTRSNTIPNSDKITAQQYEELYVDIIRCRAHQIGSSAVSIDEFVIGDFDTNAQDTDKIEEAYISGLESLMTIVEANRFKIDTADQATTTNLLNSSGTQITSTYRQSVSGTWTSFLNQIFTVTFPSAAARRHFFNSGGEIRFSAGVAYTGSQQKTADWQSSMAAMGVISFTADDTFSNSNVGSPTSVGNNNLTNTYKLCYRKDAGSTYSQSAYELYALQTSDRTIQFKVLFTDPAPGGYRIDEVVFGDWTSSSTLLVPDGSVTINGTIYDTVVIADNQLPAGSTIVQLSAANPPTPSYSLSRSQATVSEGSSASITLTTTNVSNGTVIPYTITGVSANDINIPLDGQFIVGTSNTVTIVFAADLVTEGTETLRLALSNGAANISITINDTSLTPPAAGTLLSQVCQEPFDLVGTYADGSGGTYTQLIEANSPTCGYQPPFTFSVSPESYTSQATAWDIGDVVVNTTATTSITITNTSETSGTVTVQETSRPLAWDVAVDSISSETQLASKNYTIPAGQSISVPISVIPRTILDFRSVNRQFDFKILQADGTGDSYTIYWTGNSIAEPGVPTIDNTLTASTVSGNETTTATINYSGTVRNWTAASGPVYWQNVAGTANANDFVGSIVSGSANVTITNSPNAGDGTYSFTRSIRADQTTEGTETFGTQVRWPSTNPTTSSQVRTVSIADTSLPVPITASFANTTHTFSLIPGQTETWSTTVAINSSPNNNPVTLLPTLQAGIQTGKLQ